MLLLRALGQPIFRRFFNSGNVRFAAESTSASNLSKEQLKRRELRKMVQRKIAARKPASEHPLYMPVLQALRFLRATEVGRPAPQQTISMTTLVVSERGAPLLSGNVVFPTTLKAVKIAVFTNDEAQARISREQYNCHLVGGAELIAKIKSGEVEVDFDRAFATPDLAPQLASQLGRALGPKGLLPSVKKGTVAANLEELLKNNMSSVPFRQRGNVVSLAVGSCTFSDRQILENVIAAQKALKLSLATQKAKKLSIFGKTVLSTTHGPGIVIDFA